MDLNQIKYNIIDMIRNKLTVVRKKIGGGMLTQHKTNYLNLTKYETQVSMIDPVLMRKALIDDIQEKYFKPAF